MEQQPSIPSPTIQLVTTKVTQVPSYRHKRGRPQQTIIQENGLVTLLDGIELVLTLQTIQTRHQDEDRVTTLTSGFIRCLPKYGFDVYHFESDLWSIEKRLVQPWGYGIHQQDFLIHSAIGPMLQGDLSYRWLNIENVEYFNQHLYNFGKQFDHAITLCRLESDSVAKAPGDHSVAKVPGDHSVAKVPGDHSSITLNRLVNDLAPYLPSVLSLLILEYVNDLKITTMDQIYGIMTFPSHELKQSFLSNFYSTISYLQQYMQSNNISFP